MRRTEPGSSAWLFSCGPNGCHCGFRLRGCCHSCRRCSCRCGCRRHGHLWGCVIVCYAGAIDSLPPLSLSCHPHSSWSLFPPFPCSFLPPLLLLVPHLLPLGIWCLLLLLLVSRLLLLIVWCLSSSCWSLLRRPHLCLNVPHPVWLEFPGSSIRCLCMGGVLVGVRCIVAGLLSGMGGGGMHHTCRR